MATYYHPIVSVVGTRPELQRVIPVLHELKRRIKNPAIIYIPQKHDPDTIDMLKESGIDHYDFPLLFKKRKSGSIDTLVQTVQERLALFKAGTVLVSGDTTVAVAACLAAQQQQIAIAKIGAGLRMGDFNAPEEKNDILIDHLATHLFCFSESAKKNLLAEGIPDRKITVSGSTLIWHIHETLRNEFFRRDEPGTVLISVHRRETAENPGLMNDMFQTFIKKKTSLVCITHQDMKGKVPRSKFVTMHTTPVSYPAFIAKLAKARCVITDSNTLAEEACFLGVPCITIGSHTNRPETVAIGANIVVDPHDEKKTFREEFEKAVYKSLKSKRNWTFPYGDIKMTRVMANHIADTVIGN